MYSSILEKRVPEMQNINISGPGQIRTNKRCRHIQRAMQRRRGFLSRSADKELTTSIKRYRI